MYAAFRWKSSSVHISEPSKNKVDQRMIYNDLVFRKPDQENDGGCSSWMWCFCGRVVGTSCLLYNCRKKEMKPQWQTHCTFLHSIKRFVELMVLGKSGKKRRWWWWWCLPQEFTGSSHITKTNEKFPKPKFNATSVSQHYQSRTSALYLDFYCKTRFLRRPVNTDARFELRFRSFTKNPSSTHVWYQIKSFSSFSTVLKMLPKLI